MITTIAISTLTFIAGLILRPYLSTEKTKLKTDIANFVSQAKSIAESDKTALKNELDKW